jgi:hypothetical protein
MAEHSSLACASGPGVRQAAAGTRGDLRISTLVVWVATRAIPVLTEPAPTVAVIWQTALVRPDQADLTGCSMKTVNW